MQFPKSDSASNSSNHVIRAHNALKELIQGQLSELTDSLPRYLAVTFPATGLSPWGLLRFQQSSKPLFFWEAGQQNQSHLSIGSLKRLKATGESRFEDISQQAESLRSELMTVNFSEIHDTDLPLISGGYSFEPYNVSKEWREFGSSQFILPKAILTQNDSKLAFTCIFDLSYNPSSTETSLGTFSGSLSISNAESYPGSHEDPETRDSSSLPFLDEQLLDLLDEGFLRFNDGIISVGEGLVDAGNQKNEFLSEIHEIRGDIHSFSENGTHWIKELREMESKDIWMQRVDRAVQKIKEDVFKKIVLAREVTLAKEDGFSATSMLEQLRSEFPECYLFLVKMDSGNVFLGASPERLVKIHQQELDTDALAGSAPRGLTPTEDEQLSLELVQSQKDRLEHHLVLQEILDSLNQVSSKLMYATTPGVRKLKNVQHLHTPVKASLESDVSVHKILGMLHPTPAVGGYPVKAALPYIQELENLDRGWYAGNVGWFNLSRNGEFAVSIRSSFIDSSLIRLYAGCGIVEHSDPDTEWEETCLKLESLFAAAHIALGDKKTES